MLLTNGKFNFSAGKSIFNYKNFSGKKFYRFIPKQEFKFDE